MFHDQVMVDYHGEEVGIDAGLVDLIQALWRSGFRTQFCCEGMDEQPPSIIFPTLLQGTRFIHQTAKRMWVPWPKDMTKEQKVDKFYNPGQEFTKIQLHVITPTDIYDPKDHLRSSVTWPKELTPDITKAWIDG